MHGKSTIDCHTVYDLAYLFHNIWLFNNPMQYSTVEQPDLRYRILLRNTQRLCNVIEKIDHHSMWCEHSGEERMGAIYHGRGEDGARRGWVRSIMDEKRMGAIYHGRGEDGCVLSWTRGGWGEERMGAFYLGRDIGCGFRGPHQAHDRLGFRVRGHGLWFRV